MFHNSAAEKFSSCLYDPLRNETYFPSTRIKTV